MDPLLVAGARSEPDSTVLDSIQFGEDIQNLISVPMDNASSFTALLELPPNQAVELLHSPDSTRPKLPYPNLTFPTNSALIERAARFSVFANQSTDGNPNKSVKCEPAQTDSSQPLVSDPPVENDNLRSGKRKKVNNGSNHNSKGSSAKKSKNEVSENAEKLPYVHVRARRGQATDSHSLAERARREKINARMKLLQDLVPGCNKISGTALVLDEIINHVQSLQRQVELLSMRLAAVNPRIDFNLDSVLAAECGSLVDSNFPGMAMPVMWPEIQGSGNRQQYQQQWHFDATTHQQPVWGREEDSHNFVTPENSLLSYDSSANSASRHSNQLKMEL